MKEKTEKGFPVLFELVEFIVADIGSHGESEYNKATYAKIISQKMKWFVDNHKDKLNDIYCGNVHSHHSMGAYFSGTDSDTLDTHAPKEGFWPSLVVSSPKGNGEPFAFGFSYKDQYDIPIHFTYKSASVGTEDEAFDVTEFEKELKTYVVERKHNLPAPRGGVNQLPLHHTMKKAGDGLGLNDIENTDFSIEFIVKEIQGLSMFEENVIYNVARNFVRGNINQKALEEKLRIYFDEYTLDSLVDDFIAIKNDRIFYESSNESAIS